MKKAVIFLVLFALGFQPGMSAWQPVDTQDNKRVGDTSLKPQIAGESGSATLTGGYALSFDGVDDHVRVPNSDSLNPPMITVGLWVKSALPTWNQTSTFLSKRDAYVMHPESGTQNVKFFIFMNAWVSANFIAPAGFDITKWHHYAGTFDGTSIRFYVDGELVNETLQAGSINTIDTGPLYIGKDDDSERYFSGVIDDVHIWNRALTQTEVKTSSNFPAAHPENLIGSWQFNEGSGTTASDSSGNNNHATLINGPEWENSYMISGRATDPDGVGIEGVTIRVAPERVFLPILMGKGNSSQESITPSKPMTVLEDITVVTDTNGFYMVPGLAQGRFIVTAELDGILFTPASQVVVLPGAGVANFQVEIIDPIIPETTEVLTQVTDSYLQSISPDSSVITFTQSTPQLQQLDPGDILVSDGAPAAPDGLLRKVTSISNQGSAVIVTTEPAVLEEAVEDGAIYGSEQLTPADVTSLTTLPGVQMVAPAGADSLVFEYIVDQVLYDEDENLKTTSDQIKAVGSIQFELDFEFYLKIKKWQVQQLTAANTINITDTLKISTEVELASFEKEFTIAHKNFKPIIKMIGYVPVVIVPTLDVIIGVEGDVKVGISTSLTHTFSLRAGVSYVARRGWDPFFDPTNRFDFEPPHPTLKARVKGYSGVRLNCYLYRVAGPYIAVQPYLELIVQPLEDPWWELWAGIDLPMGFRVDDKVNKILKVEAVEFTDITIPDPPFSVARAESQDQPPDVPAAISPTDGALDQGSYVILTWTSSELDADELYYDVYFGETNPPARVSSSQSAFTYDPGLLKYSTQYFWQVVAWDEHGLSRAGPVWNFTTGSVNIGEMILIPAGDFQMGCDPDHSGGYICEENELPLHTIFLDAYHIDKYEVTNAQYDECVTSGGGCVSPTYDYSASRSSYYDDPVYADYPVIYVTQYDAKAYCNWAGKRLPTEAEWEKAARGTTLRTFPWSDDAPDCSLANTQLGFTNYCIGDTSPVGSYPSGASPYGVMDMAGNVAEWVNDGYLSTYYRSYPPDAWPPNPTGPPSAAFAVYRGGSWSGGEMFLRVSYRLYGWGGGLSDKTGFRCVDDP